MLNVFGSKKSKPSEKTGAARSTRKLSTSLIAMSLPGSDALPSVTCAGNKPPVPMKSWPLSVVKLTDPTVKPGATAPASGRAPVALLAPVSARKLPLLE